MYYGLNVDNRINLLHNQRYSPLYFATINNTFLNVAGTYLTIKLLRIITIEEILRNFRLALDYVAFKIALFNRSINYEYIVVQCTMLFRRGR